MSMLVGDLIELRSTVSYLGQDCLNVWHYQVVSFDPGVSYPDVDNAFTGFYTQSIKPVTMNTATLTKVDILNLTNGIDIYSEGHNVVGDKTTGQTPSFTAYKFQFLRGSRITRHGWKRIVGVAEADIDGNSAVAGAVAALDALAAQMEVGLFVSATSADLTLIPVIIGRTLVGGVYQLDLAKVNSVLDVQFKGVTTQNTRKP